ncbi:MAG: ferrous iron transport protein B [Woeseiaceae bacterium]|nr:ferrous iron transport protein B [Woeseiaceae bacterium]MDX2607955.1 ferrous iron transport protein B [Woeseiaceae bacterium]
MTKQTETRVLLQDIPVSRQPDASIAVVGSPNSGKSTLFNRLTGMRQRIGNYPGVTVERHIGTLKTDNQTVELVDLPGTHGLSAHSLEEHITVDVVLGRIAGTQPPDGILAVVDATNLYQGLYLVQQLLELDLPVLIALTMSDAAEASGLKIDIEALSARLSGVRICPVVATTGKGINDLRNALVELAGQPAPAPSESWPELSSAARELAESATVPLRPAEIERLLIDGPIGANKHVLDCLGENAEADVERFREQLFGLDPPLAREARVRYAWVREVLTEVQNQVPVFYSWRSRLKSWINQPLPGTIGLFFVMAIVFQAVFAWATPVMDLIDNVTAALGSVANSRLGGGALSSLVSDGVIAGVGSVVIFLPQIIVLFLFIILLEDSGYLARAAYLMDRAMRSVGLSGQSIIPMISSFACAVPGIMATRVIPNRRDRIATIIAAPFMTCSARLPVYALLIAAFVPAKDIGFLNLQGLVLFGLYMFGIVAGVLTALLLRKTALRGPKPPFALMLPEFRRPNIQTVLMQLYTRAKIFLYRAGTVIFAVAVVVWALSYYPRATDIDPGLTANRAAAVQLEQSWLGRAGKFVEPVFEPLGWDWRVSSAVIAGFPAREVVVAVMGTIYAVGDEADDSTLSARLKSATWPDGRLVFTLPMVLGLLIFYACCLQCAATLAVIRRETGGWGWPAFAWIYMTSIGYFGALLVFQLGS